MQSGTREMAFLNEVWDVHCFGVGWGLGVSFCWPLQPSQLADSLFTGFPRQDRPSRPPRCGRPSGETQPPLASLVVSGPLPFGRHGHARGRRSPHPQGAGAARGRHKAWSACSEVLSLQQSRCRGGSDRVTPTEWAEPGRLGESGFRPPGSPTLGLHAA